MTTEGDRLSNLSDDIINKILSYIDTKDAIKTSILSSRWKNIWKSIPHLGFFNYSSDSLPKFCEYVTGVLSSRNNEIDLSSIKLEIHEVSQECVTKILNYAFSHNVEKMTIIYRHTNDVDLPFSIFISQSLRDLSLRGCNYYIKIKSSWDLLALTTLCLSSVTFSNRNPNEFDKFGGLLCKCPNLKNLTLSDCDIHCLNGATISHSQLSNLTLFGGRWNSVVNVVAPLLKHLTVVDCQWDLTISAPELSSLVFKSPYYRKFSADGLFSLEKVNFYIDNPNWDVSKIIDVLQQFGNAKYLTLGLEIIEALALNVQLLSHLPSPFSKLTSLEIYPYNVYLEEEGQKKINMPTEVKNYMLDGSPSATVTICSREEMKELWNANRAQRILTELHMLLKEEKIKCETNKTHIDQTKSQTERHKEIMNEQGETYIDEGKFVKEEFSQIQNYWNDLFEQMKQGGDKINDIFSSFDLVEDIMKKLPASKKDKIQERFSSVRAEACIVMKLITRSKIEIGYAFMNLL
ncbi:putative F-box/FBD/LRR-repeat protein At4g13965 [Rutidosis leptorrhynchoides]|uniref:putative F-box/FBD/LRR-repeat protein At4g13965 n=1 Tax=Rutidosis leptorrhynchoides TaxID=125765 RepID=UPI003A9997E6